LLDVLRTIIAFIYKTVNLDEESQRPPQRAAKDAVLLVVGLEVVEALDDGANLIAGVHLVDLTRSHRDKVRWLGVGWIAEGVVFSHISQHDQQRHARGELQLRELLLYVKTDRPYVHVDKFLDDNHPGVPTYLGNPYLQGYEYLAGACCGNALEPLTSRDHCIGQIFDALFCGIRSYTHFLPYY